MYKWRRCALFSSILKLSTKISSKVSTICSILVRFPTCSRKKKKSTILWTELGLTRSKPRRWIAHNPCGLTLSPILDRTFILFYAWAQQVIVSEFVQGSFHHSSTAARLTGSTVGVSKPWLLWQKNSSWRWMLNQNSIKRDLWIYAEMPMWGFKSFAKSIIKIRGEKCRWLQRLSLISSNFLTMFCC